MSERMAIMLLTDIERYVIPLSRAEKWQLIRNVQEMLMREEALESQHLSKSEAAYPLFTPVGLEEGAMKLQHYIQEGKL